jgi:hypothetical protein
VQSAQQKQDRNRPQYASGRTPISPRRRKKIMSERSHPLIMRLRRVLSRRWWLHFCVQMWQPCYAAKTSLNFNKTVT